MTQTLQLHEWRAVEGRLRLAYQRIMMLGLANGYWWEKDEMGPCNIIGALFAKPRNSNPSYRDTAYGVATTALGEIGLRALRLVGELEFSDRDVPWTWDYILAWGEEATQQEVANMYVRCIGALKEAMENHRKKYNQPL